MNKNLFSFPFSDLTEDEFTQTMNGLISKGLAERIVIDNKEFFSLTQFGQTVSEHTHADPSERN